MGENEERGDAPQPVSRPARQSWMPSGNTRRPESRVPVVHTHGPVSPPAIDGEAPAVAQPYAAVTYAPVPPVTTEPKTAAATDTTPKRSRRVAKYVLVAALALVVAIGLLMLVRVGTDLTGERTLPDTPQAYIPDTFDADDVAPAPEIAANLRGSLLDGVIGADADVASGAVRAAREIPPVIFIAARSATADAPESAGAEIREVFPNGESIRIGGVNAVVTSTPAGSGGAEIWTAVATPADGVVIAAVAPTGGKEQAENALGAMLEAAHG